MCNRDEKWQMKLARPDRAEHHLGGVSNMFDTTT